MPGVSVREGNKASFEKVLKKIAIIDPNSLTL